MSFSYNSNHDFNPVQLNRRSGPLSIMTQKFSRLTQAVSSTKGIESGTSEKSANVFQDKCIVRTIATVQCQFREGNTPDWALDMWHPWEKVSIVNFGTSLHLS